MTSLGAFVIDSVPSGYESVAGPGLGEKLRALGWALTSSPAWPERARAVLTDEVRPRLVLAGWFDEEHEHQLAYLRDEMAQTSFRYLDYRAVEGLCEKLAEDLTGELGSVASWSFYPVARGGLIVLGFLSYLLGLKPGQMADGSNAGRVVVIDDCAFSGRRLTETLGSLAAAEVVIATLLSVPALRHRLRSEIGDRVSAFLSAEDLADTAPDRYGSEYEAWLNRWSARTDDLWIGRTEHVAFPWNEPDVGIWLESSGSTLAWRLVPPDRCLKNRPAGPPPQVFERRPGAIRQAASVVDVEIDEAIVVVDLDTTHRVLALQGTASDMWRNVMQTGSVDQTVTEVATLYGASVDVVRRDLTSFLGNLADEGLVIGFDGGGAPA